MGNVNAIKYLLKKFNKMQSDLNVLLPDGKKRFNKQYISKAINRHFRVPSEIIKQLENITGVPEDFFIDKKGLCKQLNSIDIYKLDNYIESQYFTKIEDELKQVPTEFQLVSREHDLRLNITKLQRSIRTDIHSVNKDINDQISAMDTRESNLYFYEKILEMHKTSQLEDSEWRSLFKAFNFAADNIAEDVVENETPLVYGMYVLIKKSRELNAIKHHKQNKIYEELFGSLLDRFDSYDE